MSERLLHVRAQRHYGAYTSLPVLSATVSGAILAFALLLAPKGRREAGGQNNLLDSSGGTCFIFCLTSSTQFHQVAPVRRRYNLRSHGADLVVAVVNVLTLLAE